MPERVETTSPDGVDYGWVMQVTLIVTIVFGTPVVAFLSLFQTLPAWTDRADFAVRTGAFIWLVTLVSVYLYARRYRNASAGEDELS